MDAVGAFNAMLLNISNEFKDDNLRDLKFLCNDIPKKHKEGIKSGVELFQYLTQVDKLGPNKTEFLHSLLSRIHRSDLADKLNELPTYATRDIPDEQGRREQGLSGLCDNAIVLLTQSWGS